MEGADRRALERLKVKAGSRKKMTQWDLDTLHGLHAEYMRELGGKSVKAAPTKKVYLIQDR